MRNILKRLCVAGLLVSVAVPASADTRAISYTYDDAGRLVTALHSDGLCIIYVYDAAGNVEERRIQTAILSGAQWGSLPYGCFRWST